MVHRTIFDILMYCFEAFVFLYYANAFFERKRKNAYVYFGTFAGYATLFFLYGFGSTLLNVIALVLINAFLFMQLFNSIWTSAFFHAATLVVLMISSEWIVISLTSMLFNCDFNAFKDNLLIYIVQVAIHKFMYFFFCLIITKSRGRSKYQSKNMPYFWGMMIMPISSIGIFVVFHSITLTQQLSNGIQIWGSITALLLLFANLIVFAIYEYGLTTASELYELKTIQQQEEIDKTYLEVLEKNNDNMNSFIHDTKNHLETILALSSEEPVKNYVSGIRNDLMSVPFVSYSKNKILDVIISKYMMICDTKGISFDIDTKTANLSFMDDKDLSTVLNNLLDNAVEAAIKCKDPAIRLDLYSVNKAFQVLQITNSCCEAPVVEDGNLITRKAQRKLHGFGTKNVKRVVDVYNGKMDFEYDETTEKFEVMIIFPIKSK